MSALNDVLDALIEITTGSAEVAASKWKLVAAIVLGVFVLLFLLILLFFSPVYFGIGVAAVVAIVFIVSRGDSLS